jgi:dienelactone hydrolase
VLLLAGGKDDYGDPQDAQSFVSALAPAHQGLVKLVYYADGTHGWDVPGGTGRTVFDPTASKGKGGQVRMFPDSTIAENSRATVVDFFRQVFNTPR